MTSFEETEEFERAKREIHDFLAALEQKAHGDMAAAEFFEFLRGGMHRLMESVSEVIWVVGEGGQVEPICHAGTDQAAISGSQENVDGHNSLVSALFSGDGTLVPPGASVTGPDGGTLATNQSGLLVIAAPIDSTAGRAGLIEVLHHPIMRMSSGATCDSSDRCRRWRPSTSTASGVGSRWQPSGSNSSNSTPSSQHWRRSSGLAGPSTSRSTLWRPPS